MTLPMKPPKEPRSKALTVRVSQRTFDLVAGLAVQRNLSQADVITHAVDDAAKAVGFKAARRRRKTSRR